MANEPGGFEFFTAPNGEVSITHHGRKAVTLRGNAARKFLTDLAAADPQSLMAKLTGNYRRGNERTARNHPRNAHPRS